MLFEYLRAKGKIGNKTTATSKPKKCVYIHTPFVGHMTGMCVTMQMVFITGLFYQFSHVIFEIRDEYLLLRETVLKFTLRILNFQVRNLKRGTTV